MILQPPSDYNILGFFGTGKVRLRPGWFGVAIIEEFVEYRDGRREWRKMDARNLPVILKGELPEYRPKTPPPPTRNE